MSAPPASDAGRPAGPNRWAVLALSGTAQLMVVLDATIVNIALPSAQRALHFSTADREWIVTAYALAFGSLLLLGGKLGDLFGRKWTFIAGLGALRSFRRSAGWRRTSTRSCPLGRCKAVRRAVGAIGTRAFDGHVRRVPGPAEGVRDLRRDRWRRRVGRSRSRPRAHAAPFLALVPVRQPGDRGADRQRALRLLVNQRDPERSRIDVPGLLTASGGLFALVYGFSNAETQSWTATATIVALVASPVLLIAFAVIESRVKNPLLPLHIVRDRARGDRTCRSCFPPPASSGCSSSSPTTCS